MEVQINWPVFIWYEFLEKGISEKIIEKNVLEFAVKCWKNKSSLWPIWNLLQYFFTDFDHKLQDPFLNKSQGLFLPKVLFRDWAFLLPFQSVIH